MEYHRMSVNSHVMLNADSIPNIPKWMRSAGQTHHRLRGLYIAPQNFRLLFQSFEDEHAARVFAGQLLHTLSSNPVRLEGEKALIALEESWTGHVRNTLYDENRDPSGDSGLSELDEFWKSWRDKIKSDVCVNVPRYSILAQLRVSYYLSTQWEVVKEFSYIAVSEDVINFMLEFAIVPSGLTGLVGPCTVADAQNISILCERLRERHEISDLQSAIGRSVFEIRMDPIIGMLYCKPQNKAWSCENEKVDIDGRFGPRGLNVLLDQVYTMVKIGRRPRSDSFIHESEVHTLRPLQKVSSRMDLDSIIVICHVSNIAEHSNMNSLLGSVSNLCVFLTCNIRCRVTMSYLGHMIAASLKNRNITTCVQLDKDLQLCTEKAIRRVIDAPELDYFTIDEKEHNKFNCPRCEIAIVLSSYLF